MLCTAQGIQPIFYNNFTWSIIYKNIESLYCTETNIVLYVNYTSVNKKNACKGAQPHLKLNKM